MAATTSAKVWYAVAAARVLLGWIFIWAFFDKVFGLGFSTTSDHAWVNGGSPTTGFLSHVSGPFANFFHSMAGTAWADWLFMAGLLGIGVALITGIAVRLAALAGSVLLFMMWMASLPLDTNPAIDDHLVYVTMLWVVAFAEPRLSCAMWWRSLPFVKSNRWLY